MAREQRKLAAILAADVVGYSRLMGRDESGTVARLRRNRHECLDPLLTKYGGRLVKLTGDGALVEFSSAVDALSAAIEFQQSMADVNRDQPADTALVFRMGLHLGDLIVEGDDLYGDGVNIAARLEGEAPPGGIVVSRSVHDAVAGRLEATFDDLGNLALKNIERPVQAFQVKWDAVAWRIAAAAPAIGPAPSIVAVPLALPNKPSIAVLPFQNMSGDPEQDYFCDGMVEDIITGLSRIRWLFVIARNSSFSYKGRAVDVKQVGRDLGVRYVLEGSVRKAGNRVRITGQLVDAQTGAHLWAEHYDHTLNDVFSLQDELTLAVVGAIEPSLRAAEIERVKRKRPDSLDAYDLVLRALPLLYSAMPEDAAKAVPLLERALEIEPTYGIAHAHIAWYFHQRFSRGGLREEDRVRALKHARAATTHGNDDATALAVAAFVIALDGGDSAAALKLFDNALALSNSNIFALGFSAVTLAWLGRSEQAIERARLGLRLSPYDSLSFLSHIALAQSYFYRGNFQQAAESARSAIQSNPRFSVPEALLAAALVRLGESTAAATAVRRVMELQPGFTISGFARTVGFSTDVYARFAEAWREAGIPE